MGRMRIIPVGLRAEHVLAALKSLKRWDRNRNSSTYDLVYGKKTYPPKLVLGAACKELGVRLHFGWHSGGAQTNIPLLRLGFRIFNKKNGKEVLLDGNSDSAIPSELVRDEADEFPEGRVLYRLHRVRERSAKLRDAVRAYRLKCATGLRCDACGLDTMKIYGTDILECHHIIPISKMKRTQRTRRRDIALLCPSCHRVIHKRSPMSVKRLKNHMRRRGKASRS